MYKLCLTGKLRIIKFINNKDLNKKSELIDKCRHSDKFFLANVNSW